MRYFCQKILHWICAACILTGIAARFLFLDISYEYDELFTAVTSNPALSFGWVWTNWLMPDVHPPLHNFLLYIYNHFVSYGPEIWLRLPSVLFGLGALAYAWLAFPKRFGKTVRLVFMGLLSCQMYGIFYAQHARAYALMLLLSVPLTFLFLNMSHATAKGKDISRRQWAAYAVLSLLLCWSHYFGALLFGAFSVLLLAQAVIYKRCIGVFLLVPAAVFVLFLPWLLPNLWANISLQRFDGAWWANEISNQSILPGLTIFFFSSFGGYVLLMGLVVTGLLLALRAYKRTGHFARGREILLLLSAFAIGILVVAVLNFKIYLFFGRYFMPFIPCVYLSFALITAPLVRRYILGMALLDAFLLNSLFLCFVLYIVTHFTGFVSARISVQAYKDMAPDKELFVVAMEAFPPSSMNAMYAFYPNQVFKMGTTVTELYNIEPALREAALARRDKAVIWMPNCTAAKLGRLSQEWGRAIGVAGKAGTSCFLELTDKGVLTPPADWQSADTEQLSRLGGW